MWIKKPNFKQIVCAMVGGLVLTVGIFSCTVTGECADVRSRVVRLHILANSDSQEDQELKLQVRDAVLQAADSKIGEASDKEEALLCLEGDLSALETAAQQTVAKAGYTYPVKAELCRMYFTTRTYGAVTLPAGMYEAVRMTIGEGKGHNWWCVVFPPLCLGSASGGQTLESVLTPAEVRLVNSGQKYRLRFKCIEWVEALLQRMSVR